MERATNSHLVLVHAYWPSAEEIKLGFMSQMAVRGMADYYRSFVQDSSNNTRFLLTAGSFWGPDFPPESLSMRNYAISKYQIPSQRITTCTNCSTTNDEVRTYLSLVDPIHKGESIAWEPHHKTIRLLYRKNGQRVKLWGVEDLISEEGPEAKKFIQEYKGSARYRRYQAYEALKYLLLIIPGLGYNLLDKMAAKQRGVPCHCLPGPDFLARLCAYDDYILPTTQPNRVLHQ